MRDSDNQYEFTELFLLALQGRITPEQFKQFDLMLSTDPAKIRAYVELMEIYTELSSAGSIEVSCKTDDTAEKYDSFLHLLTNEEKTAPAVTVPQKKPMEEFIQKMDRKSIQIRINRGSLITLLLSMAAVVLFVLIVHFVPSKTGIEVATLTDSITAKWADADTSMGKGTRLVTGSSGYLLREGIAQIEFDNMTKVTIESPAEFEIVAGDQVKLNYGRIYARVPREAIGFTVKTLSAQVVDLGTEFGINTDFQNNTMLYVMKGKTVLIAGDKSNKESVEVTAGVAKKVSAELRNIADIAYNSRLFVREINSAGNIIWRGETAINLADIVGGGNGLGTGRPNHGIMVDTGKLSTGPVFLGDYNIHYKITRNYFCPVPEIAAVDGIFVPDGGLGNVVISSQGHIFEGCPRTSSTWCVPIINGAKYKSNSDFQFRIKGQAYGTAEKPGLFLHANIGITYDLNVIRKSLPEEKSLTRFTSIGAALDSSSFGQQGLVDIWILVDGQVRFSKTNVTPSEYYEIDISLSGEDRFLSLAVTDGIGDFTDGKRKRDGFDWVLFGTPELRIE